MSEKKIALKLEFYLRGKNRTPAVSFIGMNGYGVPLTPYLAGTPPDSDLARMNAAFDKFSKAAHEYCKAMRDEGEFK
jgi:hypothetical protein